jgi:dGTPase
MRDQGGFEGNGQTLRILTRLERFSASHGADLTRRTLLGTLKYPVAYSAVNVLRPSMHHNFATRLLDRDVSKPPKCFLDSEGEIVNWILNPLSLSDRELFQKFETSGDSSANKKHGKPIYKSLDCSIMDTSDDIAYGVHDLEDVISLGLVDIEDFLELVSKEIMEDFFEFRAKFSNGLRKGGAYEEFVRAIFSGGNERKHMISRLVYYFVSNCVIVTRGEFHEPLLKFSILLKPQAQKFVDSLKNLVRSKVIYSPSVQHLEFKGQQMVIAVFEVLASDPKSFLPKENYDIYERNKACKRVICDYVAGMTDKFLLRTYERLFSPRMGSVFDKL